MRTICVICRQEQEAGPERPLLLVACRACAKLFTDNVEPVNRERGFVEAAAELAAMHPIDPRD